MPFSGYGVAMTFCVSLIYFLHRRAFQWTPVSLRLQKTSQSLHCSSIVSPLSLQLSSQLP